MDTDVVIAGGGPTGLVVATELRLAGADVIVLDRLAERSGESRAGGLHARTMEILDQRGTADRFLAAGHEIPALHFSALPLRFTGAQTRFPYVLGLIQSRIEGLLEDYGAEMGVRVRWSSEVTGFDPGDDRVEITLASGKRLRAKYLVGCDGGRSTIRKLAGIEFPGTPPTSLSMFGDVELTDPPDRNLFQERRDSGAFAVLQYERGWYRVFTTEHDQVPDHDKPVTFERLHAAFVKIAGTDYGMHSPRWVSQFGDAARQAMRYRSGRVLLAGDAAHIHAPAGGQGLNTGVQDAFNLGWKLGAVVRGDSPETLLDTYHAERHPVGARVLHNTRAQMALWRPGPQVDAMRDILSGLLEMDNVNAALRDMIAGLDIKYDLGSGHPLLGRRAPDLTLKTADGDVRVAELLRRARPLLLDLGAGVDLHERVDVVPAQCEELDVRALLIRPDGHVAWTSAEGPIALRSAVATWC